MKSNRNKQSIPVSQSHSQLFSSNLELTNQELFELAHHHDKFIAKVSDLIGISQNIIDNNHASDAIVYLVEAERILEYAASCGKNIDRKIIMSVLHNQAYAYQRMWELDKCSNYLEALIYNINQKIAILPSPSSSILKHDSLLEHTNQNYHIFADRNCHVVPSQQPQSRKTTTKLQHGQKLRLIKYHLQYSAVNSQLKNHKKSIESGKKSLKYLKQLFAHTQKNPRILQQSYPIQIKQNACYGNTHLVKLMIDNLKGIHDKPHLQLYGSYVKVCKHLYLSWQKRQQMMKFSLKQQIKKITIGSVMQIHSYSKQILQTEQAKLMNSDYLIFSSEQNLSYEQILYFIILMCITYFTLSTQLRLQSLTKNNEITDSNKKEANIKIDEQHQKEAEIYHLICLCVYFIYIPISIDFLEHVIKSYENHYNGDIKHMLNKEDDEIQDSYLTNNNSQQRTKASEKISRFQKTANLLEFKKVLEYLDPNVLSDWDYSAQNKVQTSQQQSLKQSKIQSPSKQKNSRSQSRKKFKNIIKQRPSETSLKISSNLKPNTIERGGGEEIPHDQEPGKQLLTIQRKYKKVLVEKYIETPAHKYFKNQKTPFRHSFSDRKLGKSMSKLGNNTYHMKNSLKKKLSSGKSKQKSKNARIQFMSETYDQQILAGLDKEVQSYFELEKNPKRQLNKLQKKKTKKSKSKQSSHKSGGSIKRNFKRFQETGQKIGIKTKNKNEREHQIPENLNSPRIYYECENNSKQRTEHNIKAKQLTPKKHITQQFRKTNNDYLL